MQIFYNFVLCLNFHFLQSDKFNLESDSFVYFDTSVLPNDVVTKRGSRNSRYLKPKVEGNGTLMASLSYHRGDPEIVEVTFKTNVLNDVKNFLYYFVVFSSFYFAF